MRAATCILSDRLYGRFCIYGGHSHREETPEGQQSLFSWAEFVA